MIVAAHQTMLAPPALPYDAEVEYLESTGTQYLDTGYAFTDGYTFELDFDGIGSALSIFGSRSGNVRTSVVFRSSSDNLTINIAGYNATTTPFKVAMPDPTARTKVKMDVASNKGSLWVNGVNRFANKEFTGSYISGVTMGLFATKYGANDFREITAAKVYSLKMWQGDTLVRDFIPVRVGSGSSAVGYLCDRVSGNLFGNAGTGAFTIGPDKT